MRTTLISALLFVHLVAAAAPAALAQGAKGSSGKDSAPPGTNSGPGDTTPHGGGATSGGGGDKAQPTTPVAGVPTSAPVAPRGVTSPRELFAAQDPTSWDLWWQHNRDPYLALRAALDRIHSHAGASDGADLLGERRAGVTWKELYGAVVPAIVAELETSRDERVVRAAMLALARIGEAPPLEGEPAPRAILPLLTARVGSAERAVAETAVIALGVLGTHDAVRELVEIARDTEPGRARCGEVRVPLRTRALATYGIGIAASFLSRPEVSRFAAWHLHELLREDGLAHPDLQAACVIALGLVPVDAPSRDDGAAGASRAGAEGPWSTRSRGDEVAYLLALFRDRASPRLVRAHAPAALARLVGGASTVERERVLATLVEALDPGHRESSEVRTGCMLALGVIADGDDDLLDARARALLHEAIGSHDAMERNFAAIALGQAAARGGRIGDGRHSGVADAGDALSRSLESGKSRLQPWAAVGMGLLGHGLREQGVEPPDAYARQLAERMASTSAPEDAAAYAIAAGLVHDPSAREAIEEGLVRFRDEHWRAQLAIALGLLGDARSIPVLGSLMEESELRPELYEAAAVGRAMLGDLDLIPTLIAKLPRAQSWTELAGVTRALGWTADARALAPLVEALGVDRRTDAERAHVIEALGWIGDKERVVWDARVSSGLNYPAATQTLTDPWGLGILDTL